MGPIRTSGRGGGTRAAATAAVGVLALAALTTGCRVETAGAAGTTA
ncbi:murein L,D-transpeptidase, partial [Streptomyces halstedii]|nr:murein L,D-transpeptidase [Streptomyces halstedii]